MVFMGLRGYGPYRRQQTRTARASSGRWSILAALLALACVRGGLLGASPSSEYYDPLPAPNVTQSADVSEMVKRLERDLARSELSLGDFVAPEELVAFALRAVEDEKDADAMFWFSLASVQSERIANALTARHESAAEKKGLAHLGSVNSDRDLLRERDYRWERSLLLAKMNGTPKATLRALLDGRVQSNGLAGVRNAVLAPWNLPSVSDELANVYPQLGSRLWLDLQLSGVLPLAPALAPHPNVRDRETLIGLLSSSQPQVRLFAASGLALNGDAASSSALEQTATREADPGLSMWVNTARLVQDDREALEKLKGAIPNCAEADCDLLLYSYASAVELKESNHDEQFYRELLQNEKAPRRVRSTAAWLLGMLQQRGQLSDASLLALMQATQDPSRHVVEEANRAIEALALPVATIRKLVAEVPSAAHALLVPWAQVATAEDLGKLRELYSSPPPPHVNEHHTRVSAAVANIPGAEAAQQFVRWYGQGEQLRLGDMSFRAAAGAKILRREPETLERLLPELDLEPRTLFEALLPSAPEGTLAKLLEQKPPSDTDAATRRAHAFALVVAIHTCQAAERDDVVPALWRQLSFSDPPSYPAEMLVRDAAGRALFASLLHKRLR